MVSHDLGPNDMGPNDMGPNELDPEEEREPTYRVQVLDRTVAILEELSKASPGMGLPELCKRVDLHKSTVHRLLTVLEGHRLVDRAPSDGKYRLGLRLFELGSKAVSRLDVRERARPYLHRLAYETGETTHLCIPDQGDVLYLEKVESEHTIRIPSSVGRRHPSHCTAVGKALLACMTEHELDEWVKKHGLRRYTANTYVTPRQLKEHLQTVRRQGFAVDNEEIEEGVKCVGAPVRDYTGKAVASISIAGPAFRMTDDKIRVLANAVLDATSRLSDELGFKDERAQSHAS